MSYLIDGENPMHHILEHLDCCSADEFDYDNLIEDVVRSLNYVVEDENEEQKYRDFASKLIEYIRDPNEQEFTLHELQCWHQDAMAEIEEYSNSHWSSEEPRAFGYAAYVDATGGDFSSSDGCRYCGGNGWNCC